VKQLPCWQAILGQCWRNIVYNIGPILGTILPQYWQRYTTTILADVVDQYWANVGRKYWTDIGKTRCTILAQYWAQYCPNIGSATQRQYLLLNHA